MPKGGGDIQDLGETFSAVGVAGTVSLRLPFIDTGRVMPVLTYSRDEDNGLFGVALSMPHISRRTPKGVAHCMNADEFVDASGEVLTYVDKTAKQTVNARRFHVMPYALCVAGSLDRLGYWQIKDNALLVLWLVRIADGASHLFSYIANARVADLSDAIQQAAAVHYDALFSWMEQLDADVLRSLSNTEQQQLRNFKLVTPDGYVRACRQWATAAPMGSSNRRWAQIRSRLAQAYCTPVQAACFIRNGYSDDVQRKICCAVSLIDDLGRARKNEPRVALGPVWMTNMNGNLVFQGEQPVSQHADAYWGILSRVEYNNKGLAVRVYQPYLIDPSRYVNNAGLQQFPPHNLFYYGPARGRQTKWRTKGRHNSISFARSVGRRNCSGALHRVGWRHKLCRYRSDVSFSIKHTDDVQMKR